MSQADAFGEVLVVDSLSDIQGKAFPSPTVIITERVGGMEDIPVSELKNWSALICGHENKHTRMSRFFLVSLEKASTIPISQAQETFSAMAR